MADVRRFDIHQKRDPNGEWGDGVLGPDLPDFDLDGIDVISDINGSFGNAVMGIDPGGDVRLVFREGNTNRELDLSGDEFHELGDVLQQLNDARDDIADDAGSDEVQDEYGFGAGHRAELYGNGVIGILFGADDPDPWTLNLDPPDGEDADVQTFLDAMDDVFNELDATRSAVRRSLRAAAELSAQPTRSATLPYWLISTSTPEELRRYNASQKRDPNGEWGDGVPGPATSGLKDALKLAEAVEQNKAENEAWDELERLEASPNPDPARLAALRQITGRTDEIVFDKGIVPGSAWGDVHWSVELDDPSVGPTIRLGVMPKGAPDDWGNGRDWQGQFDPAEIRKFLRLLDKYAAGGSSRNHNPREAPVYERFNDQHAPAGSATGGQFAAGGGGGGAAKKAAASAGKSAKAAHHAGKPGATSRPARPPGKPSDDAGTLAYDPASNHGPGYDSKTGDPRVHALQQALTRLGLKDSAGKPLKDDGKLGPKTTSAVKALQTHLGLKPDGKVTPALLAQVKSMKTLPDAKSTKKRSIAMDYCIRAFAFEFEERSGSRSSDGRTLEGYAAVFNSPTRIAAVGGDFDEVITPGAFARSIRARTPVLQFEHGRDPRVGAVPIGSIEDLSEDSQGLHVRARLFDNAVVEPVRQAIEHRAIKGMSFRFNVVENGDTWTRRNGALDLRSVGDADVHELGPVVFPAYDSTTVSVRSLLAQLGPEEHLTLLRELAYDLRSIDLDDTARKPSARSSGSGDTDRDDGHAKEQHLSIRQRLDQGALQARGILT